MLHRRSDLTEGYIVAGLLAVFLLLAPLAGVLAGRWADHAGLHDQRQQHGWRQVTATLLTPAPGEIFTEGWSRSQVQVWTAAAAGLAVTRERAGWHGSGR